MVDKNNAAAASSAGAPAHKRSKRKRAAREDEIADKNAAPIAGAPTPALKKRKRRRPAVPDKASAATAVGASDDILGTILAYLPGRTAIACTALSKHHRSLIRSPWFRSLHCRLGAPLPRTHVAYLAAASVRSSRHEHQDQLPTSRYYGFHIAGGAGLSGGGNNGRDAPAPVRSLVGWRFLGTEYVNTCNGVLLLATEGFSDDPWWQCTLWNPAVADGAREPPVPSNPLSSEKETSSSVVVPTDVVPGEVRIVLYDKKTQFLALGLGFGRRSDTYKLLLCRKDRFRIQRFIRRHDGKIVAAATAAGRRTHHFEYSLVVHSLGGGGTADDMPPLRTVLPMETVLSNKDEVEQEIMERKSLYMDGTIYFLYWWKNVMLAFDVDNETVHTIDMPGERQKGNAQLIEMSGRPCLVIVTARDGVALWLLTTRFDLVPMRHVIPYKNLCPSVIGVWDFGSVLVLGLECSKEGELVLYDVAEKKILIEKLQGDWTIMNKSNCMLCWGYKPTLVSPKSILGEISQDMERRRGRSGHVTEAMIPLVLQERRKAQKATLRTVCLMEFLVRIMQMLPHDLRDVLEMPKMDSEEPGSLFQ